MRQYFLIILLIASPMIVESSCPHSSKYYIDCSTDQTASNASAVCDAYGMTLLNVTNSSTLLSDVHTLNQSLLSSNYSSNFWLASANGTAYTANASSLGQVADALINGVFNLFYSITSTAMCAFGACSAGTTNSTRAAVICVRPIQPQALQKCPMPS